MGYEREVKLKRFKVAKALEDFHYYRSNPGLVRGVSTGFSQVDYLSGGMKRDELILLASRPGVGKTQLALGIAYNACMAGKSGAVFEQEMSEEQMIMRLAALDSGIPVQSIQHGYRYHEGHRIGLTDADYDAFEASIDTVSNLNLGIHIGGLTTEQMREAIRTCSSRLDFIIDDHIGLHTDMPGQSQYQRMTSISRALKDMKLEFHIPILAIAQLNRAVESREDKRPQLSDLRDSGSLEQDADQVWAIYREDYYDKDGQLNDDEYSQVEICFLKNRAGPTGVAYLQLKRGTNRFMNRQGDDLRMNGTADAVLHLESMEIIARPQSSNGHHPVSEFESLIG